MKFIVNIFKLVAWMKLFYKHKKVLFDLMFFFIQNKTTIIQSRLKK